MSRIPIDKTYIKYNEAVMVVVYAQCPVMNNIRIISHLAGLGNLIKYLL